LSRSPTPNESPAGADGDSGAVLMVQRRSAKVAPAEASLGWMPAVATPISAPGAAEVEGEDPAVA